VGSDHVAVKSWITRGIWNNLKMWTTEALECCDLSLMGDSDGSKTRKTIDSRDCAHKKVCESEGRW
jgi:hypothetical protein